MEDRRNRPEFKNSPTKWRYDFIKAFFTFWRTVKMYGGENDRIDENIERMAGALDFFLAEKQDDIALKFDGIDVIIDKYRIRGRRQEDKHFEDLYDLFLSVCLAEVRFTKGISSDGILAFFRALGKMAVGKEPKVEQFEKFVGFFGDIPGISVKAYDPEEAGNLPLFSNEQKLLEIFRALQDEMTDQREIAAAGEQFPLVRTEMLVQSLVSILSANREGRCWDFALFLAFLNSYRSSFPATRMAARVFLSVAVATIMDLSRKTAKRAGVSAFYTAVCSEKHDGFMAMTRMDEFSMSRVDAAVSIVERPTAYTEEELPAGSQLSKRSSMVVEILNVVGYYDTLTAGNSHEDEHQIVSRVEGLRRLLDRSKRGLFLREFANGLVRATGVIPPGCIQKIRQTDTWAVPARRFISHNDMAEVFVLNSNFVPVKLEEISGDRLADIPASSPCHIPAQTLSKMLSAFVK